MDGGLPSACASNFSISVGSPGRGGDGGVGGAGGIGLPGLANTVQGTTGHAGGGGGRGCGGGGGAGGRGGSAIGVLYDTTSRTPAMVLPAWATNVTLTGTPGAGGSANAAGPNGAQYGSNQCSVTTASDGPPGVALTSALVPWRSCADARAIDSDWPDGGSAFVVDAADLVVSTTCP
jgi:hypothetical protein